MRNNRHRSHLRSGDDFDSKDDLRSSAPNSSELLKKEQEHRHKLQMKNALSFRLGQIFSLIYNVSIIILIYTLVTIGEKKLAIIIFCVSASIIIFAIAVLAFEKRVFSRNSFKSGARNYRARDENSRSNNKPISQKTSRDR